jgi:hypothetical protein
MLFMTILANEAGRRIKSNGRARDGARASCGRGMHFERIKYKQLEIKPLGGNRGEQF